MRDLDSGEKSAATIENDPVVDAIQGYIYGRQKTDFGFFSISFGIKVVPLWKPADADGARTDGRGRLCNVTWPDNTAQVVRLRRSPTTSLLSEKLHIKDVEIQLRKLGKWSSAFDWLQTRFKTKLVGCGSQKDWWDHNGKVFPLMKLPKELRCCLYDWIFGPYIWPCVKISKKEENSTLTMLTGGRVSGNAPHDPIGNRARKMSTLIYASKTVSEESRRTAWEGTTKHFNDTHVLISVISHGKPPGSFNHLSRISLGLYNNQYLKLLHFHPTMTDGFANEAGGSKAPIRIFSKVSGLKHLHLKFALQLIPNDENDPWAWMVNYEEATCQKVFVDWFFMLALEHIRHIPRITLSGHVKDSTRTKWEKIFDEERRGACRHEFSEEIEELVKTPVKQLPPLCRCTTPCHWWKIYGPFPEYWNDYEARVFKCED